MGWVTNVFRCFSDGMYGAVESSVKDCEKCVLSKNKSSAQNSSTMWSLFSLQTSWGGACKGATETNKWDQRVHKVPTGIPHKGTKKSKPPPFGLPAWLHSDQGHHFKSEVVAKLCKLCSVKKTRTKLFGPQGTAQCGRHSGSLNDLLRTLPPGRRRYFQSCNVRIMSRLTLLGVMHLSICPLGCSHAS